MTAVACVTPATVVSPASLSPAGAVRSPRSMTRRALIVLAFAVIALEVVLGWSWLASAASAVAGASGWWATIAVSAGFASMVCFSAVRQRTAHAVGLQVPLRQAVSVSYAAGALHITLPGGAVFSTAYVFRQLRGWGASPSIATWCLAITGVLATGTLTAVGLSGVIVSGGFSSFGPRLILEIAALAAILRLLVAVTRRPRVLLPAALGGLRILNRIRRRPDVTDAAKLTGLITGLDAIRPSAGQWVAATLLSLANWLFDAGCLWACCNAVGIQVSLPAVLLAYTAGMAATSLSPLPAGIGIVEGTLAIGLTAAGAAAPAALAAVLIYRLISIGGVTLIGWLVLAAGRSRQAAIAIPRTPSTTTPSNASAVPPHPHAISSASTSNQIFT